MTTSTHRRIPTLYGLVNLHEHLFVNEEEATQCFLRLRQEIQWTEMMHKGGLVPRLVALQGEVSAVDGSIPLYRYPTDENLPLTPFNETVLQIKVNTILSFNKVKYGLIFK
jgi:hypothetical protein